MKVLFGTDGSRYAEDAAKFLAKLPHDRQLDVNVMSVYEPVEIHGSHDIVSWMDEHSKKAQLDCGKACERVAKMFEGADATVSTKVVEGHAATELLKESQRDDYDLVVVGAQGHSLLRRMLLGSVSDFIATHAKCSVLVVRPQPDDQLEESPFKMCVAYDHSSPSQHALNELKEFGWKRSTHIDVIGVLNTVYADSNQPVLIDMEPVRKVLKKNTDLAAEQLADVANDIKTQVLEGSHVGFKIADFTEKTRSNLLVVGSTGSGMLTRFLLGSVSRYVLRHATCSVWISRDKTQEVDATRGIEALIAGER